MRSSFRYSALDRTTTTSKEQALLQSLTECLTIGDETLFNGWKKPVRLANLGPRLQRQSLKAGDKNWSK